MRKGLNMELPIQTDSSGHEFVDIPAPKEEHIRATLIPACAAGYGETSIRIQIRGTDGHLRQGPEVPLSVLPGLVAATIGLIRKE